jgi:type IV protein arginine methyltransferase
MPTPQCAALFRISIMTTPNDALDDALRTAARDADADAFFALIARGADPTTRGANGVTALMLAASANCSTIVDALLSAGVPWFDVDDDGDCAGQYASGYGHAELARAMMDFAVRDEIARGKATLAARRDAAAEDAESDAESAKYLATKVTYDGDDKLLDEEGDAVMMTWEAPLMEAHADVICAAKGRVLNVGFGMGVIDGCVRARKTSGHTIIEAHPDVRAHMTRQGWDDVPGVSIEFGRWQDVLPKLIKRGVKFDGVFFDTYGEDYDAMRIFHAMLPKIMNVGGVYSYFNGMCPDNIFFHMVYNRVAEEELRAKGFKVTFDVVAVDASADDIWKGVKRRYWWGDKYFLPTCVYEGA